MALHSIQNLADIGSEHGLDIFGKVTVIAHHIDFVSHGVPYSLGRFCAASLIQS